MSHRSWGTDDWRWVGLLIIAGFIVFTIGAGIFVSHGWATTEGLSAVESIVEHQSAWKASMWLVATALLMVAMGVSTMARRLKSPLALAFGGMMLVAGGFGVLDYAASADISAEEAWAETGTEPEWYHATTDIERAAHNLWKIFSNVAMVGLGIIMLKRLGADQAVAWAAMILPFIGYFIIRIPGGTVLATVPFAVWAFQPSTTAEVHSS